MFDRIFLICFQSAPIEERPVDCAEITDQKFVFGRKPVNDRVVFGDRRVVDCDEVRGEATDGCLLKF
jgi:hypothetical protein